MSDAPLREILRARADAGDVDARKCLNFLDAPRSPGRTPKNDAEVLATICALVRSGVDPKRAIATVSRSELAGRRDRERWSRKLRKFSAQCLFAAPPTEA